MSKDKVSAPELAPEHDSVDENGERFVHEFDEKGNFVGWHKEPAVKEEE